MFEELGSTVEKFRHRIWPSPFFSSDGFTMGLVKRGNGSLLISTRHGVGRGIKACMPPSVIGSPRVAANCGMISATWELPRARTTLLLLI
jgi:hypothetical protein